MTILEDQLNRAADATHRHIAQADGGAAISIQARHQRQRILLGTAAAAAMFAVFGASALVMFADTSQDSASEPATSPTTAIPVEASDSEATPTVPVAGVAPEDLPRFNLDLDDWFMHSGSSGDTGVFTYFERDGESSLAHLADIYVRTNNTGPAPFNNYEESLAQAIADGEDLGTVTLGNGVTAEAFYFPNPGLYHEFIWQHSDSVWIVAQIQTSTRGEANRADAFDEAKRIAGAIEPVSLEDWTELVAASVFGYHEIELQDPDELLDLNGHPLMPGERGTTKTMAWNDWVTNAMQAIGFEVEWIDVVELEGREAGQIHARVVNPDGDEWLLAFGPWRPGEYNNDIEQMYSRFKIDEPGKDTPEGTLIVNDMRPTSVVVHLWMGEDVGRITVNAQRWGKSTMSELDPSLLEALVLSAAPTARQLLDAGAAE